MARMVMDVRLALAALVALVALSALATPTEAGATVLTTEDFFETTGEGDWFVKLCVRPSCAATAVADVAASRPGAATASAWRRCGGPLPTRRRASTWHRWTARRSVAFASSSA